MKQRFNKRKYGQRWQTETVNSMIKRRLGSALRARGYWSQCREIVLRATTHNVMIVILVRVFYRAIPIRITTPACSIAAVEGLSANSANCASR